MTQLLVDHTVVCPSCWEPHVVTIDLTEEERHFIEDCHVCCNPMEVRFQLNADSELTGVTAIST